MSGKPWSEARRIAFAAEMKRRWRKGLFEQRRQAAQGPEQRAASSKRMKALNERMRTDKTLKRKVVKGQKRARRRPAYRAMQALVMAETMAKPENREKARRQATINNRDPAVRKKQWATRRRKRQATVSPEAPPRPKITGDPNAVFLELLAREHRP